MKASSTLANRSVGPEKSFGKAGISSGRPARSWTGLELTISLGTAGLLTAVFAPLTTYLHHRK